MNELYFCFVTTNGVIVGLHYIDFLWFCGRVIYGCVSQPGWVSVLRFHRGLRVFRGTFRWAPPVWYAEWGSLGPVVRGQERVRRVALLLPRVYGPFPGAWFM